MAGIDYKQVITEAFGEGYFLTLESRTKECIEKALQEKQLDIGMTLQEAVERLTPKKPIASPTEPFWTCPTCGQAVKQFLRGIAPPHCMWCAQALKWD